VAGMNFFIKSQTHSFMQILIKNQGY